MVIHLASHGDSDESNHANPNGARRKRGKECRTK